LEGKECEENIAGRKRLRDSFLSMEWRLQFFRAAETV
jgi:hypothetical protein